MSAGHPVVCSLPHVSHQGVLWFGVSSLESGDKHFIHHSGDWECTIPPSSFRKGFHHHGQSPSLLPNGKFLLLVVKPTWTLLWQTGTLLCQPNVLLLGTVSQHLPWCRGQTADWTSPSPGVPSTMLLLSLVSPDFRRLLSPACFYLRFWSLRCLALGLGCWLLFLEKSVMEPVQDVLTTLFRGNFPRWRSLCVSPRLGARAAVPSNLDIFTVSGSLAMDLCRT